ncbi:CBS domain-containing protein [Halopseudomonas pertucinogena]|uniref:CBS domain-containing protein n=1 Tax=Halopseudomonas pertucinogena TaxID=86175 RepID=A0ABQ2CPY4_9GAMM|nr:CBS domain-containing protein [Halopseudomonas pertucinogena]GGI98013.1 hypothetical protein GCM10009083_13330 [Halopseudomonas pertucinogena]
MIKTVKVRDYMNREVVTLNPDTHLFSAIDVLLTHRVSGAPVVDAGGHLVGVLSESDCLKGILNEAYFEETCGSVKSIMSQVVETIDADADILEAAAHFVKRGRRRLPVTEQGRLVGQISRRDLLRVLKNYNEHGTPRRR